MSAESDQAKLDEFAQSFKSNLLDMTAPLDVETTPEEKGLESFETAKPYPEDSASSASMTAQDAQDAQEQADKKKHRRGNRAPTSVDPSVLYDLASTNQALNQRLEYDHHFYQNELGRLQAEVDAKERKARELEQNALKVKEDYLVKALASAKAEGDYETEAQIQRSLSAIHAELSTVGLKDAQFHSQGQPYYERYSPPPPVIEAPPPPLRNEYVDWLEANPWFSPDSPEYNPELAEEVMGYAKELNKHLQIRGMSNTIDTADYYRTLDQIIQNKYDLQEDTGERMSQIPSSKQSSRVAPVHRQASLSTDRISVNGKRPIYLDADEREIALSRKKTHSNGTPYTPHELLQYHAQLKARLDEHDKAYGIKPNHYKTTLRFG